MCPQPRLHTGPGHAERHEQTTGDQSPGLEFLSQPPVAWAAQHQWRAIITLRDNWFANPDSLRLHISKTQSRKCYPGGPSD